MTTKARTALASLSMILFAFAASLAIYDRSESLVFLIALFNSLSFAIATLSFKADVVPIVRYPVAVLLAVVSFYVFFTLNAPIPSLGIEPGTSASYGVNALFGLYLVGVAVMTLRRKHTSPPLRASA